MSGLRVLVCGGRDYADAPEIYHQLGTIHRERVIDLVITGGARGADAMAHHWAIRNDLGVLQFFADWKTHGKAAGPLRNQRMIKEGEPDLVVAFSGGKGTEDMKRRARKAGVKVLEIA